jgi:hypothetical protein
LLARAFDLNQQAHTVGDAQVKAPGNAPQAALDRGFEVAAADRARQERVQVTVADGGLHRDRVRRAARRQRARDLGNLVAVEAGPVGDELGVRVLRGVKEVLALQLLVERRRASARRRGVDRDMSCARSTGSAM